MSGLALLLVLPAAFPAAGAEAWFSTAERALERSPVIESLLRATASNEAAADAARRQAPWTIRSTASYSHFFSDRPADPTLRLISPELQFSALAEARLDMNLRERLDASLVATGEMFGVEGENATTAGNLPFSVRLRVGYDVLRGGEHSSENDRAYAESVGQMQLKLRAQAQLLGERLAFQEVLTRLLSVHCQEAYVAELQTLAARTLESAETQLTAKVMTQTDFLNFQDLDNSIRARQHTLLLTRARVERELERWGADVARAVSTSLTPAACTVDTPALRNASLAARLNADQIEVLSGRLPGFVAASAAQAAAVLTLEAQKTELEAGLSPFVEGAFGRRLSVEEPVTSVTGGLALEWNLAQTRGDRLEESAEQAYEAAVHAKDAERSSGRARVGRVVAELERQARLLKVLEDTLKTSEQLAKTLEVRRSIGDVNSLNLVSATIGVLNARIALVDSWTTLLLGLRQLETYRVEADAQLPALQALDRGDWAK